MKYVIPGGAGFVGKNLVRVMLDSGIPQKNITIIDKDPKGIRYLKTNYPAIKSIQDDLAEKGEWMEAFNGAGMIILLAAQIKAKTYEPFKRNNIDATARVIEAARKHGVEKIFHFSSASVLSIRKDAYAKTKKASEQLVLKSKLTYIVIRPSMMYGPLDNKNIGWLINFSKKIPIFPIAGDGKYHRQPIYIDDVSKLVIKMMHRMEKGTLKNQTYSINGPILEFGYMCKTVVKKVGGLRFTVHVPIPIFKFAMKIYNIVAPDPQFTTDQVDSLTSGDVFDRWEWWKEYGIKLTPFDRGVEKMLKFKPRRP